MKIGIIGAGNVGGALGKLWAGKGHEIVFGVPDPQADKVAALLRSIDRNSRAGTVSEAAAFGEVVVFATPWQATHDAVRSAGDLDGKVVIDCTNPLMPDLSGLVIGTNNSAGEEVARWAEGAKVVKAFNTIGAANFGTPQFGAESASMFIAGNDADAKATVARLAAELGFDVVDAGPLTAARWLEALGILWIHLAFKQGLGPAGHAFKLLRRPQ
ncbi:MAG TPA: NADPH-dependent F420 reductase [Alphaproteobacteria bacterium]|nr:NADPH-dependent F420 reductase [Alphaproteobacteria bacterium]